jgi:hypothetical protein
MLPAIDQDRARSVTLVILATALLGAVVGWRDPDIADRLVTPLVGGGLLAAAWLLRRHRAWTWVAAATGAWYVAFGLMLARSHVADCINVSGQCDLGPDPAVDRAMAWLEPAIQRPIAVACLVAGTVLVGLALRSRRRQPA